MGRLLHGDLSDAPTMLLSPQQSQGSFTGQSSDPSQFSSFNFGRPTAFASGTTLPPKSCLTSLSNSSTALLCSNPKRKRSHSDFVSSEETISPPPPMIQEQPVYGEGMTLINPRTGMGISAESQSGTWLEENMETRAAAAAPVAIPTAESEFRGRKLQRFDATASGYDDITAAAIRRKLQNSTKEDSYRTPHSGSPSSFSSMEDPRVDDFTQILGISWQRIFTDDRDMAAAIRGWEKYINNHYARYVQDSEIILKHKGLHAYVVASRTPVLTSNCWENASLPVPRSNIIFYLFNEDLTEARHIASDWETCAGRLRCSPIEFEEGSEVITASDRPVDQSQSIAAKDAEMNSRGLGTEMTMDLDS